MRSHINLLSSSKKYVQNSYFVLVCFFSIFLLIVSHGLQAQPTPEFNRANISPSIVELKPGEHQQFNVTMLPPRLKLAYLPDKVIWYVNDIPGGNEKYGTIDSDGLYKAPEKVPSPPEINIVAVVEEAANSYLWATVLLGTLKYRLIDEFSESIDSPKYFDKPHSIAFDIDGNLLITDENSHRVFRMTTDGEYIGDIGSGRGQNPGEFLAPRVAWVDSSGKIFVLDQKSDDPRIQVFSRAGKFIRIFGEKGTGPGQILRGHGLDFNENQDVFIADVDNMRVNVYSNSGEFLYDFGKDGLEPQDFNAPHGLAIDANNDVFVNDYYSPVKKFGEAGNFLFAFAYPTDGIRRYHALNTDRYGNIYLTGGPNILKYNNNGDFLTSWTLSDSDLYARWATVDDSGKVYVAFTGGKAGVKVFMPE